MERSKKASDRPNVAAVFTVAAAGALLVYTAVVGLQAFYQHTITAEEQRKAVAGADTELRSLSAAQLQKLIEYRWVNQEKKVVTIPIERAMDLVAGVAASAEGRSLVPALVRAHDKPTVPAVWGRPPDNVQAPAPSSDGRSEGNAEK